MGTISHNAILVTDSDEEWLKRAASKAAEIGCIVLGPSDAGTNAYRTVVVCPDGSKEGWKSSDDGDLRREAFVKWLHAERQYCEWAEVRYGELGYAVLRSDEDEPL